MKPKKPQSSIRYHKREAEKKFEPAIKKISEHLHNTSGEIPKSFKFKGYQIPAGTITDRLGREWQFQVSVVLAKDKMLKKNEISPIQGRWTLKHKIQSLIVHLISWSNSLK